MPVLSRFIYRPSLSKAVCCSALVHAGALAAFHYWMPMPESDFTIAGSRNALYVQSTYSEYQPHDQVETQSAVELETAESNPTQQLPVVKQVSHKPPELVRREAIAKLLEPSELAVAEVEVEAQERPVELELPERQVSEATSVSLTRQSESSQLPRRSVTASSVQSTVAVEEVAGLDDKTPPSFSGNRPPTYPAEAIRRSWQGTVVLQLTVSATGQIERVEVLTSSGHQLLDQEAVQAVSRWRGQPARHGGQAISSVEVLPIIFRLNR